MGDHGLYIQLFSPHGLIRGSSPELGKDADTGGQVKYVLELAMALGKLPEVERVDLFTRLIKDKRVSEDYGQAVEHLGDKVQIVRMACGPGKYLRKELLWPYLDEFIDNTIKFIKQQQKIPDIFHGHYADGGYIAMELAAAYDAPFLFTGHSLGRNKEAKLLAEKMSASRINKHYRMAKRIEVEEQIIASADLIITSTRQEITHQYGLYRNYPMGNYKVITPGIDLDNFYPYYYNQTDPDGRSESSRRTRVDLLRELYRFWVAPHKPFILALCRPDKRKNIHGLVEAYGKNKELQAIANLAIFAGIRKNIQTMEENEKSVLTDMLLMMDYFDLYGKMAIPKKHDFESEVPELYRLCAESGGVFINPALVEPFGITLIEASACGLPIVATNDGGPIDIVTNCNNGILVDVARIDTIGKALTTILADRKQWDAFSRSGINGVRGHYSWQAHCIKTLEAIFSLTNFYTTKTKEIMSGLTGNRKSFGQRLTEISKLLITDIDNTLLGDDEQLETLLELLEQHKSRMGWGVATGRSLDLTLDVMTEYNIPIPDVLICSVGTEIYYGPDLRTDKGWHSHIEHSWNPEGIKANLETLPFLTPQEAEGQRRFKISYYMEDDSEFLERVHQRLKDAKLRYELIYSHGQFLDILPHRASKGKAVGYLQDKWKMASGDILVAGDSGNDEDMLKGKHLGLVVGNHSKELDGLKSNRSIYFSEYHHAGGIIDGLSYYRFI